ncbi:hypothetical protein ACPPVW_11695 [Leifsonia sp. McL0607]|uniref:hypothetical protein n=1 Tax=Leifsonia sp. McL0607 TaxID=3415672 RepID=UPI003CF2678D
MFRGDRLAPHSEETRRISEALLSILLVAGVGRAARRRPGRPAWTIDATFLCVSACRLEQSLRQQAEER